jgi:predicted ATPase
MVHARLKKIKLLRDKVTDWEQYPFSVPVIRALDELDLKSQVTYFVGENGSGKSTLLEAIAYHAGFSLEGGTRNTNFRTSDSVQSVEQLSAQLRLSWSLRNPRGFYLRAESFFNHASYLDQLRREQMEQHYPGGDPYAPYGGKSLHLQSHGESFMALLEHNFKPGGLFILDEPEAALSPARQLSMLVFMRKLLTDPNTQFIISTHSPIVLSYPDATILSFDDGKVREISYEESLPFQVYSSFLTQREKYLKELFAELF